MSNLTDAFRLGQEVCGPLFKPFCEWIVQETNDRKLDHLLFLARDGQLLMKLAETCNPRTNLHYCYVGSRASWYRCTPYIISRKILDFRIRTEYFTLAETCKALGFNHELLFNDLDIEPDCWMQTRERDKVTGYLTSETGREQLKSFTQRNRELLVEYLCEFGVRDNQNIAIVDVGWNGHFQTSLEVMLEPLGIKVSGFYFGLNRWYPGSMRDSYFYCPNEQPHWMSFYPCLIEMLTPADHPAVSVLESDNGRILPRFSGPPVADPRIISDIHDGALACAHEQGKRPEPFNIRQFVERPPEFAIRVLSNFFFQKPFSPEQKESFVQLHSLPNAIGLSYSFRRNLASWHWPQANLQQSGYGWMAMGLTRRFEIGAKLKSKLDKIKSLLFRVIELTQAIVLGLFDSRSHDLESFDVFDTLLYRQCGGYFQVFEELEEQTGIEGLAQLRKSAEVQLIIRTGREVTLDEIYQELAKIDTGRNWSDIMNCELDIEQANLTASEKGLRTLRIAREMGAKIIFLSDMYMRKGWIEQQLLRTSIWEEGDQLFVSNELNANKRSGKMYTIVRNLYPDHSWRHSGDNLLSDVLNGFRAGASVRWQPHSYYQSIQDHWFRFRNRGKWRKHSYNIKVRPQ